MLHSTSRPPACCSFLFERDQLGKGGAGKILDVAEVQQDLLPPRFIDQAEELFADGLDVRLVQNLAVGEIDNGHVADVFDFEPAATGLRRHASLLRYPNLKRAHQRR